MSKLFQMGWASMLALGIAFACGYVANIAKLINTMPGDLAAFDPLTVFRALGVILLPRGAVLGFF